MPLSCVRPLLRVLPLLGALLPAAAGAGTLTVLHSFTGGADGATPYKGPALDKKGNLYGGTFYGADACPDSYQFSGVGCGAIYKYTPGGTTSTLLTFKGARNGADSFSNLTIAGSTIYGGTYLGGTNDLGVLFQLSTAGKNPSLLHVFNGMDGANPSSFIRIGSDGTKYSVAQSGGPGFVSGTAGSGQGVLFALQPDGTLIAEHDFSGGDDGGKPGRIFLDASDTIYGTTATGGSCSGSGLPSSGCGVIYSFVPSTGAFAVLHTMNGTTDGFSPTIGAMDADGNLYGVGYEGGAHSAGTLFEMKRSKSSGSFTFKLLYSFTGGADGAYPLAPALSPTGALIGNTINGPVTQNSNGAGVLYSFQGGVLTTLYTFLNDANGGYPQGTPVLDKAGNIYGTAAYGGITPCNTSGGTLISSLGCGVLFEYTP